MSQQRAEFLSGPFVLEGGCPHLLLAQQVLERFGRLRFRATGGSMLPAIAAGDVLEFRACRAEEALPGQVLLTRRGNRLVAHRVVAHQDGHIQTRGDALTTNDDAIAPADVLGVLVAQQRGRYDLHPGGRQWRRRHQFARWLIRHVPPARTLFTRVPHLATLTS